VTLVPVDAGSCLLDACVNGVTDILRKRSSGSSYEDPRHPVKFHMWLGKKSWSG